MTIRLSGKEYDFEFIDGYFQASGNWGFNNCNICKVVIDNGLSDDNKAETLIHELIHIIDFHNEIGLEHRVVSTIASNLYEYISNNKAIRDILCKNFDDTQIETRYVGR